MMGMVDKITIKYLDSLIVKVKELALQEKHAKTAYIRIERQYWWDFEDFEYTHSGIKVGKAGRLSADRENLWTRTFNSAGLALCYDEFKACEQFILVNYPEFKIPLALRSFVFKVYYTCLLDENEIESKIEEAKTLFLIELNCKPLKAEAIVNLVGITLESQEIAVNNSVSLRRTHKDDFAEPGLYDLPLAHSMPFNTAVLTIRKDIQDRTVTALQEDVERYMFLLKIFCLGSVQYKDYKFKVSHITAFPGANANMFSGGVRVWQNYYLSAGREQRFIRALNTFKVPGKFFSQTANVDYLTTAFDRYKESITEIGTFEKRVSTAIMGIEALLNNDSKELTFKLAVRAAKILSCLGFDGILVKNHIIKGYNIRSSFAHGGFLQAKEINKLNEQFGNIDRLAMTIINYLRIIVIVMVQLQLAKDEFIKIIDNSLIDDKSLIELRELLKPVSEYVEEE